MANEEKTGSEEVEKEEKEKGKEKPAEGGRGKRAI